MAFQDLREFIHALEKRALLKRVTAPVDPILEISEINDRVVKSGGPALLFENVKGHKMPVAINLFGSEERMAMALGVQRLDEIAERLEKLLEIPRPTSFFDKLATLPLLARVGSFLPKRVKSGPCQEVVEKDNPSFDSLPVNQCWPDDGGRYVTMGLVFTRDPIKNKDNVGMYRIQIYDERTSGMHWQIHKHGRTHERAYSERGDRKMPVSVVIGADPAMIYSATAPLPDGIHEVLFAGFLRESPVELVKCVTNDLEVPARAEIVLEGWVDPDERRVEGPFGDHNGYYSAPEPYPVFHLECITRRRDAIYNTTLVGPPPMEDYWLGKATERIFLPLLRLQMPEIVDFNFPAEGVFHNCCLISIRKRYPGHAKKVMHALWGLGQMMFTKLLVVVDHDVNVQNCSEVAWKVLSNVDWRRDVVVVEGPVDALDHASPYPLVGGKMGVDVTRKGPEEGMPRAWPPEARMSKEIHDLVSARWTEYGL
ncbi:MAG: menaquinone biosynthesis decarboxylase [Armatimonadetes bacterium]|nr:menaquinone biosynthesis decarboxylase [Armatimonadota bacterium]